MCPAISWEPVEGVLRLLPKISWDRLQQTCEPLDGWKEKHFCWELNTNINTGFSVCQQTNIFPLFFRILCKYYNLLEFTSPVTTKVKNLSRARLKKRFTQASLHVSPARGSTSDKQHWIAYAMHARAHKQGPFQYAVQMRLNSK